MLKNESGISLIEILATVTILSIIGVIIWQVFFQGYKFSESSVSKNNLQQEANLVISTITRSHQTLESYTIKSSGCKIDLIDATGVIKATFENDKLCYKVSSNGSELVSKTIKPNEQDLNIKVTVYDVKQPSNTVSFDTLLYRLKEGDLNEENQ